MLQHKQPAAVYWVRRLLLLVAILMMVLSASGAARVYADDGPYGATAVKVTPTLETDPVPNGNDTADDIAVWVHPTDRAKSRIIGVDKAFGEGNGGLLVYNLAGDQTQPELIVGSLNNVDIRYNFPLNGQLTDLIVASNQKYQTISIFRINGNGFVEHVSKDEFGIPTGMQVYGSCMYRSPTGKYYAFITQNPYNTSAKGIIQQWELFDAGSGKVGAELVDTFEVGSETESCVADDVTGDLYVAETRVGIWRYGAEPNTRTSRTSVDFLGAGRLPGGTAELEGVTLYYAGTNRGYLIVSEQFSDTFFVYRREKNQQGGHDYVTSFQIGPGNGIDGVNGTDGLDVTNVNLGPGFPQGAFIAHDQENTDPTANSNYKVVPWESIAGSAPSPLTIDTSYNPRGQRVFLPFVLKAN